MLLFIFSCTSDLYLFVSSVQELGSVILILQFSHSVVSDSLQPHGLQHSRPTIHHQLQSLPKLMSIESMMPSNHLILCHPLLLLPSIFPRIGLFSNDSALGIRRPKYWVFSFNISPSNEHPGLISFRTNWLDLFAVQGTSLVCIHLFPRMHCSFL